MVCAVLVHDGEPLDAAVGRGGFGDVDPPGIEITVLAGNTLIDLVGDYVRDAPPVLRRRGIAETSEVLLGEHIPESEFDARAAVRLHRRRSGDQSLGVDDAP